MPDSVLAQLLVGLYLGVLTGVIPALVSWALGFSFRYVTGVTVPGLAVVVVAAAIAGVSGGWSACSIPRSPRRPWESSPHWSC